MGKDFWRAAEQAAGAEYGKSQAAAYARREKLKRTAGAVALGIGALYLAVRTWGAQAWDMIELYALRGLGALLVFIAFVIMIVFAVRTYRTSKRSRTYTRPTYMPERTYVRNDEFRD